MNCPKCNMEINPGVKFCGSCGSSLTNECPVCGSLSILYNAYCPECGSDKLHSKAGIPLGRAIAWRDQFQKMGWCDDAVEQAKLAFRKPSFKPTGDFDIDKAKQLVQNWRDLLTANNIPEPFSKSEPWLFAVFIRPFYWTISVFRASIPNVGEINPQHFWQRAIPRTFLLATRCRIVFVDVTKKELLQWSYKDIRNGQVKSNGDITLTGKRGK
jgi:hypothetical protein